MGHVRRAKRVSTLAVAVLTAVLLLLSGTRSVVTAGCEQPGKVTGGGYIPPGFCQGLCCDGSCAVMVIESASNNACIGGKATFGFTVQCCPDKGNLVYHDHVLGVDIKAVSITSSSITCPYAEFEGWAKVNGTLQYFRVLTFDGGEPGSAPTVGPDAFQIQTSGGYFASGELVGGNIQCAQ